MTVFGSDDRTAVNPATGFPWSAVVKIEMDFDGDGSYEYIGSGAMIGANDVITAAHVIWDPRYGFAQSVRVTPGLNGNSEPYGSATASVLHVPSEYTAANGSNFSYDIGVINLSSNIGNSTGWFGMKSVSASSITGSYVNTAGYPGDLDGGEYMYRAGGYVDSASGSRMYYDDTMDTYGGQSGSGVWTYNSSTGDRSLIGVHTSSSDSTNGGTLLTSDFYNRVVAWSNDGTVSLFTGTAAADLLSGTSAADTIFGYSGNDTLSGGGGADVIYGNVGLDLIRGGDGDDTIFGGQNTSPTDTSGYYRSGTETISGGAGNDVIYGNFGSDSILAESGADTVYGGQDNDVIFGGDGNDVLFGNLGNDQLYGDNITTSSGSGYDTIYGGDGVDVAYYFSSQSAYSIAALANGGVQVGGADILYDVEYISFAGTVVSVDSLI